MLSMLSLITYLILALPQEWAWNVYPESGFKILSPVSLVHKVTEVPTVADKIEYHQFHGGSLTDSLIELTFVIDHYFLPAQQEEPDEEYLRDFFETTIEELLLSVDGTLLYMDFLRQSGQDLCIWKASLQNGEIILRGHSILTPDAYYGLQVFGLKKNPRDADMTKFLESFKRIERNSP